MTTHGFHLTTDSNLANIMAEGLAPAIGPRSLDLGEPEPAVYLFPTLEDLESALGNWLGEYFEEDEVLHVLKVDITGFAIGQEVEWEYKCFDVIPASAITYVRAE